MNSSKTIEGAAHPSVTTQVKLKADALGRDTAAALDCADNFEAPGAGGAGAAANGAAGGGTALGAETETGEEGSPKHAPQPISHHLLMGVGTHHRRKSVKKTAISTLTCFSESCDLPNIRGVALLPVSIPESDKADVGFDCGVPILRL